MARYSSGSSRAKFWLSAARLRVPRISHSDFLSFGSLAAHEIRDEADGVGFGEVGGFRFRYDGIGAGGGGRHGGVEDQRLLDDEVAQGLVGGLLGAGRPRPCERRSEHCGDRRPIGHAR